MAPSTLLSLTVFFLCGAICWGSGAWLAQLLLPGPRNLRWWTFGSVLGLGAAILTVANLNYVGIPVRIGAPVSVAIHIALSIYFCRRESRPLFELDRQDRYTLGLCLLGLIMFAAPYWATGAYPFFGDSYSNCSVADFVRDNGYHTSPEPIHEQNWKTQMWSFANGHFRMGVPYLLATTSAFLGLKAYWTYVGVCFFLLSLTTLSFGTLAHSLFPGRRLTLLAIGAFSCNLMMVHWSLASGFLPQTIGLGIAFLMLTTGLELGTGHRSIPWIFGILLTMHIAFYPEMLPFMLVPLVAAILISKVKDGRGAIIGTAIQGAQALGVALLVNGYNVYYAALGYIMVFRGRPMNALGLKVDQYFTMSFGLSSLVAPPHFLLIIEIGLSVILGAICVLGWLSLRGRSANLVWSSLGIGAPIGAWMAYSGSEYSMFKVVLYLFYLVPLGTAAGLAFIWNWRKDLRLPVLALTACWVLLSGYVYGVYMGTAYNVLVDPACKSGTESPAAYMQDFTSLEGVDRVVAPHGKTLLLLRDSLPGTWVSYFFRAPAHQHILGVYAQMLHDRPSPPPQSFSHILTERARSGWMAGNVPLFQNNRYSLIASQPMVSMGGDGWYQTEYVAGEPVHWMKDTAELLAFAPTPSSVVLEADSILGPHGNPRQVAILHAGKPVGTFTVSKGKGRVRTPTLSLPSGFSNIEFRSDGTTVPLGADTRLLNILFGRWSMVSVGPGHPASQAQAATPAQQTFALRGATEDQWITEAGAYLVPSSSATYRRLRLEIEAADVPKLFPLRVKSTDASGLNHSWTISKGGRYEIVLELPRPVAGELHLIPDKHFVPRDIGANSDTRRLSFRLLSCTPVP